MTTPLPHDRPLTIYCSACADTRQFPGETCWHCGAVAESTFQRTGYRFVSAIVIGVLALGLLWGIAADRAARKANFAEPQQSGAQYEDRLGPVTYASQLHDVSGAPARAN